MKFTIEVDERQMQVLVDALDMYGRMGMGQLDVAVEEFLRHKFYARYHEKDISHRRDVYGNPPYSARAGDEVKHHINEVKDLVFGHPPSGSWGIRNEKVPWDCREAYDIQQVVRKALVEYRRDVLRAEGNEEGVKHLESTVWMQDYWATNPEIPPAKVRRAQLLKVTGRVSSAHQYSLAVDFDGVIHQYTSPWVDATTIVDPPMPGAFEWLTEMSRHFNIIIHTCRLKQFNDVPELDRIYPPQSEDQVERVHAAILAWFQEHGLEQEVIDRLSFWTKPGKPTALVYIDDRGYRFRGSFPTKNDVHQRLRPWKHNPGRWFDARFKEVTEMQVVEDMAPLTLPSAHDQTSERLHAEMLIAEGTADAKTELWARRVVRAYLVVDGLRKQLAQEVPHDPSTEAPAEDQGQS